MDYEKILESLKICSEVGTSCDGCSGRGERHCIANLTKAAAIAIETLLHALDMARGERDIVTKRMVELEQEACRLKSRLAAYIEKGCVSMNNAQKIRSMSDEELSEFLWDFNLADVSTVKMGEFGPHMFRYRLKEWLQQPAEGIAEADLKGSDG